ncbi:AfsR/SARP family transcriptional regulator [Flindersiella endophytica]
MELRVLGPIELCVAGQTVRVRAARQRGLLSLLLLERGHAVSTDRLIERMWADPPAAARITVQTCVYRLRNLFRELDVPFGLSTQSGGYLLEIPQGMVDLDHFDESFAAGVQAQEAGDPRHAASAFRTALRLWRGEAFLGIDLPAVREYAALLEERRRDATEQCLAAELEAGRHAAVAGELEELTRRHPLRESFWRLRMLALVRGGRKADALETYQQLYRLLGEELGIEPSAPVRELHHRILTDDATLATSAGESMPSTAPADGPAAGVVPRLLPPAIDGFVDRKDELTRLDVVLPPETGSGHGQPAALLIAAISGMAGVGKTVMAVHWAHQVADQFPDGQLYVNLRGFHPSGAAVAPGEAIRGFLDALRVPAERIPSDLEGQAGLYRSMLAGRRVLVVLDNARDSEQVRPLLPGSPGCAVLVTSRNQLAGLIGVEAAKPFQLGPLTIEESRELLARRLGQDRIDAEPHDVDAVVARCARLPLALAIVAGRISSQPGLPIGAFADELIDPAAGLDAFTSTGPDSDAASDVRTVFSWSYRQLSAPAARLFRLLGLHPGTDISAPAAASLAGLPLRATRTILSELTGSHLLARDPAGRYTLHDLLRTYAGELSDDEPDADRRAAVHRLLDHYLHTASTAARLISPARRLVRLAPCQLGVDPEQLAGQEQALAWLVAEQHVLLAALHQAADIGFDNHTWQLATVLADFLTRRGHWHEETEAFRAALKAAERLGDYTILARVHRLLASSYVLNERYEDAHEHLRRALELSSRIGDHDVLAETHRFAGMVLMREDRHAEAVPHAKTALKHFLILENPIGQVRSLSALGWCYTKLGQHEEGAAYCRHALELGQDIGDRQIEAHTWDSLGHALHHLGDHQQAIDCFRKSLDLHRRQRESYYYAITLTHLAQTQHTTGDRQAALESWQAALAVLEELGHSHAADVRAKLTELEASENS